MLTNAGCVIIGRNEGERLERCLDSVCKAFSQVVYVDSGSTDQSVQKAQATGAQVVNLDMTKPFTAARARNAGLAQLYQTRSETEYVQFIDGDCELVPSWPNTAAAYLDTNPGIAVVCGRRRERYPDASVYNRLCDIEWNTPIGEATACGGDALMRIRALNQVNAFNANLIAGEEPEMCHRLRMQGWQIFRLDEDMTLHDAAISRFGQWWKRAKRAGYAFAAVSWLHRNSTVGIWQKEVARSMLWGAVLPLVMLLSLIVGLQSIALIGLLLYGYLLLKIYFHVPPQSITGMRFTYSLSLVLIKFAEAMGSLTFIKDGLLKRKSKIIEYK